MSKLHISDSLALPLDAVTQKFAILGRTGSGKSYCATKLCEEMLDAKAQVIALDPVGVWYGLRVPAVNTGVSPFSIPIFGGLHGDVPLEHGAGEFIANLIIDREISAVLDVSQFLSGDQAKFAYDFATRFFFRKKSRPGAVHLFIEECQEFVPQNISGGSRSGFETRMLGAFERLIKLGRNFGIGATLISQRPQEVNKKALNQAECMLAFQMTGPQERKAVASWVADKAGSQDVIDKLPKLEVGQCQVWSPQWLQVDKTIRIAKKKTADVSSTPAAGAGKRVEPKQLSDAELVQLSKQMIETVERAKAEDPRELRKKIAELERQLNAKRPLEKVHTEIKTREVPVLKDGQISRLEKFAERMYAEANRHGKAMSILWGNFDEVAKSLSSALTALKVRDGGAQATRLPPQQPITHPRPAVSAAPRAVSTEKLNNARTSADGSEPHGQVHIGEGERRCAIAIAQHPNGVTREQLTTLTGYKRSTRNTYLQRLSSKGLIVEDAGRFIITQPGVDYLGDDYELLPTGAALQRYWIDRLPAGESQVFQVVLEQPEGISRDAISEVTQFKRSTRNTYIQRLAARELVVASGEIIRPSDTLFG